MYHQDMAYTTGDVSELFNISTAQVKNWCQAFSVYLSESARPGLGEMRHFTDEDMGVFALIADRRARKMSFDDIGAALRAGQREPVPTKDDASLSAPVVINDMRRRLVALEHDLEAARADATAARLEAAQAKGREELASEQLAALQARVEQLAGELAIARHQLASKGK